MKKVFKKPTSLKGHLWMYFCTFAVVIMAMLWMLQTIFLGTFYNSMKLNELKKVGKLISEQYNPDDEDFYEFWFEHSFNSGIFAQLVTENGESIHNFYNDPRAQNRRNREGREFDKNTYTYHPSENNSSDRGDPRGNNYRIPERPGREFTYGNFEDFIDRLKQTGREEVSYIVESDGKRGSFGVYGTYIGELEEQKVYLSLMSPLERTDTTRKVLQTQLLIASCLSILLALAIAYFIAKRFSKPVENINKGAALLAKGDYSVYFEKGAYKEIDELSDTLNYATKELSKTEGLRRDLISNVSHDLRTPLTIIKSYAELIRDISGTNEEKRKKHTEIIIEEANNLSLLVNDMLDLSKIQSGTMPMEMKEFDFSYLVNSTVKRFDYYRENQGFIFETESIPENVVVCGDERRMEQVIYNLLANAVNYTGEDKRIKLGLEDFGDRIRFFVKDTGCGIPDDEIDLVWDKYYKSSESHKREKVGTGIGLSIVKNILIAHNAGYGVHSEKDKGSQFWFELNKNFTQLS